MQSTLIISDDEVMVVCIYSEPSVRPSEAFWGQYMISCWDHHTMPSPLYQIKSNQICLYSPSYISWYLKVLYRNPASGLRFESPLTFISLFTDDRSIRWESEYIIRIHNQHSPFYTGMGWTEGGEGVAIGTLATFPLGTSSRVSVLSWCNALRANQVHQSRYSERGGKIHISFWLRQTCVMFV